MKKIVVLSAWMTCSTLYAVEGPTNIILINLDDVGFGDFSCNGAYGYTTPNIDALASQGVRFTLPIFWLASRLVAPRVRGC